MSKKLEEKIIEIQQVLNLHIKKRLKARYVQKLKKNFLNCVFSKSLNRFFICTHKNKLNKDSYSICSDQLCSNCSLFQNKYDKEKIKQQFKNDISDPCLCGNKEPKIAVLIWVLNLLKDEKYISEMESKKTLWQKVISLFRKKQKNGYVQK